MVTSRPFQSKMQEEACQVVLRRNRAEKAGGSHPLPVDPLSVLASRGHRGNLRYPFQTSRPFCALCLAPQPWGPKSGKGMSGTSDGLVCNNNSILLPQDVISQTCAQPPLSQAWGTEVGGWCERQEAKTEERSTSPAQNP